MHKISKFSVCVAAQSGWRATALQRRRGRLATRGARRPRSGRALPPRCWCAACCTPTRTRRRAPGCRCAGAPGPPRSTAPPPTPRSCRASFGPAAGPPCTGARTPRNSQTCLRGTGHALPRPAMPVRLGRTVPGSRLKGLEGVNHAF